MTPALRDFLSSPTARRIGTLLSLSLVAWIAWLLYHERHRLADIQLNAAFGMTACASIMVVMAGNLLGSVAMRILLVKHNPAFTVRSSVIVTGMAQLAKYLPGNVVHLVGRFLYIQRNTSAGIALWFSLFEVLLLASAAGAVGVFYLYFLDATTWPLVAVIALGGIIVLATTLVLPRTGLLGSKRSDIVAVLALYLLSYLGYGLAFALLMQHAFGLPDPGLLLCSAVFALAFLGGYVTPGAPGGLGVREFLMMTLSAPLLDATAVLGSVVLFRFLSIAGDLLFGLLALCLQHLAQRQQAT